MGDPKKRKSLVKIKLKNCVYNYLNHYVTLRGNDINNWTIRCCKKIQNFFTWNFSQKLYILRIRDEWLKKRRKKKWSWLGRRRYGIKTVNTNIFLVNHKGASKYAFFSNFSPLYCIQSCSISLWIADFPFS